MQHGHGHLGLSTDCLSPTSYHKQRILEDSQLVGGNENIQELHLTIVAAERTTFSRKLPDTSNNTKIEDIPLNSAEIEHTYPLLSMEDAKVMEEQKTTLSSPQRLPRSDPQRTKVRTHAHMHAWLGWVAAECWSCCEQ